MSKPKNRKGSVFREEERVRRKQKKSKKEAHKEGDLLFDQSYISADSGFLRPQETNKKGKMEPGNSSSMPAEDGLDLGRISLRPFNPSDVEDFMVYANDERVGRFLNNWNPVASKEHALEVLNHKIHFHPWFKSICLDDKSIGSVSVNSDRGLASEYRCRAEIGYALRPDYWNKGIATHVVKLVCNAIFWEWPHLERLEALVDVENVASQRVLEKAGFEREGVLKKYFILKGKTRDMVIYSFLSNTRESQN